MIEPVSILHFFVRIQRAIVDGLQDALESAQDPLFREAYEAELGLPPGSLENVDPPSRPDSLDTFIDSEDAGLEQFMNVAGDMVRYIDAWRAILEAALSQDSGRVLDELLFRVFELSTLNHVKYHKPLLYWVMRLSGYITTEVRVHAFEQLRYDNIGTSFKDAGAYFKSLYADVRFQTTLPDPEDPCAAPDDDDGAPLTPAEEIVASHTADRLVALTDIGLGLGFLLYLIKLEDLIGSVTGIYGWEPGPETDTPIADQISDRALTLAFQRKDTEDAVGMRFVFTQLLFPNQEGGLGGWFAALRGDLSVEQTLGEEGDVDPWKLAVKMFAPDGGEVLIADGLHVFGNPTLALEGKLSRKPAVGPALSLIIPGLGTRLELGEVAFKLELNAEKAAVEAQANSSALIIDPEDGDGFIAALLTSQELRLNFEMGLVLDNLRGLYLKGGAGLSATLPINKSLGPIKLQTVHLSLGPKEDADSVMDVRILASFSVKVGAVVFTLDRFGVRMGIGFGERGAGVPEGGTTLIPSVYLDGTPGREGPNGVGIAVNSSAGVSGGGFLFYDAANGQYAGVLELSFEKFAFKAVGILTTDVPDALLGFSLMVVFAFEEFEWNIGAGIKITGLGGMIGLNHGADVEALRAGLRNRALDSVLFPENPVANAPRIAANLRKLFPPRGRQFIFGLTAKFEWPTPTLFTGDLGILMEFPSPTRLLVLGQLRARIPYEEKAPITVNVDALGVIDFDRDELALDATLYDSSIIGFTLSGDAALRMGGSGNAFLFAMGGFHPRFTPPPNFPRLNRLAIHFSEGNNLRMRAECYLAVTSNSLQFGADLDLQIRFAGFSIEGHLGFHALMQSQTPELIALIEGGISLKWKGLTLFGVWLDMTLSGYRPWCAEGKVTFEVWGFSKSKSFDTTFGDDSPPISVPETDLLPEMLIALAEPRNWRSDLPDGSDMLVTLRQRTALDGIFVHPLGQVGVQQRVAPLNIEIEQVGGARLRGDRRFSVELLTADGQPLAGAVPLTDLFAPGQFLQLSKTEKLTRPSFEPMDAGFAVESDALSFGTDAQAAVTDLAYETCILGADGHCIAREPKPHRPALSIALLMAAVGPAAKGKLRQSGQRRYQAPGPDVRVQPATFTVASSANLLPAAVATISGPVHTFTSYTAARQALTQQRAQTQDVAENLHIVPSFETEATG